MCGNGEIVTCNFFQLDLEEREGSQKMRGEAQVLQLEGAGRAPSRQWERYARREWDGPESQAGCPDLILGYAGCLRRCMEKINNKKEV